jgi:hypothetical protein
MCLTCFLMAKLVPNMCFYDQYKKCPILFSKIPSAVQHISCNVIIPNLCLFSCSNRSLSATALYRDITFQVSTQIIDCVITRLPLHFPCLCPLCLALSPTGGVTIMFLRGGVVSELELFCYTDSGSSTILNRGSIKRLQSTLVQLTA